MAARLDAILISGGNDDIDPINYGELPSPNLFQISSERDFWEFALYQKFKEAGKPILGICRGCQVINVFEGGSLFQNLCEQIENCSNHFTCDKQMCELYHTIKIEPDSRLYQIFGSDTLAINSFHNQAVKQIAPEFKVSALSEDGIIEAIETNSDAFIIGIQAHPEALTADYPHFMNLFEAFISAARKKTDGYLGHNPERKSAAPCLSVPDFASSLSFSFKIKIYLYPHIDFLHIRVYTIRIILT